MKQIITLIALIAIGFGAQAQKKNFKTSFEVDGICTMCKKRIEKAALGTKGVKYANWNVETHQLSLIIDQRKTDTLAIQKNIAKVGHDTHTEKTTQEAYDNLHDCCKYKDIEVIDDHKKKKS
ncbi:MAG: cation transporter [Flavobacteriaceae bacterium]|nr:cation transporter [Flavobacteriaceae bacterium]